MARINNLTNFVTDVAAAIKTKSEISRTITPSEFDTLIMNIQTGIDISDSTVEASDVLEGKIFYTSNGVRTVGTAPDLNQTITALENQVAELQAALDGKAASDQITVAEYNQAVNQVEDLLGDSNE